MPALLTGYGLEDSSDNQILIDFQHQTAFNQVFSIHPSLRIMQKWDLFEKVPNWDKKLSWLSFFPPSNLLDHWNHFSFFLLYSFGLMHALAHICHLMFHVNYIKIKSPIPQSLFHIIQTELDEFHRFGCS